MEQHEAQSLLENIDNFARLFKLLPKGKRRSKRFIYQNFSKSVLTWSFSLFNAVVNTVAHAGFSVINSVCSC